MGKDGPTLLRAVGVLTVSPACAPALPLCCCACAAMHCRELAGCLRHVVQGPSRHVLDQSARIEWRLPHDKCRRGLHPARPTLQPEHHFCLPPHRLHCPGRGLDHPSTVDWPTPSSSTHVKQQPRSGLHPHLHPAPGAARLALDSALPAVRRRCLHAPHLHHAHIQRVGPAGSF
jgi:hypothetical protein